MIKALAFDVFGTVVDWRGSLIREGELLAKRKGVQADWAAFADACIRQTDHCEPWKAKGDVHFDMDLTGFHPEHRRRLSRRRPGL